MFDDFYDYFRGRQPGRGPGGPGRGPGGPGRGPGVPGGPGFPGGPGGPGGPTFGPSPDELPPPPAQVPTSLTPYRIDPGAIWFCRDRYTFIVLENGQRFWFYPIFIGRRSVAGFRWSGFFWYYYGVDLDYIVSFTCV